MKISNTVRIRNPTIRDDHTLAVRVNLTADSGGGTVSGTGADAAGGCSGDTDGSLLMLSSFPFSGPKGTKPPRKAVNASVGCYEHAATARAPRRCVADGGVLRRHIL